jgi:hypothetical protein
VRKTALAAIAMLFAGSVEPAGNAAERSQRPGRTGQAMPARLAQEPNVIGMIRYDTGINAGFHPDSFGANLNRVVGNRFNTNLGGPLLMTNRVFTLTVFPANDGSQSVSIATGPNSMGTAMVIDYLNANLVAGQFNAIPLSPPLTVGPEFLALFLGTFGASQPAGLLGMSDMGTMGQGYHAIEGFYRSNMSVSMLVPVPNRNAMVRARIDVFPVELMEFEIR